ncbi:MAG: DUF1707 SHOCT-like domain-containing protein [Solirubrobacteraceae bacterium]
MDPAPLPSTRAADADRERALVVLRDAAVAGRLTLDEFADRVERAELARTLADLEALTSDLPAAATGSSDVPARHRALFARLERRGRWTVAARSSVVSVCGTITLDLGHATLQSAQTTLHVRNLFGTVTLIVPRGIHVDVDGGGPFSTREIALADSGPVPDAPRLHIRTSGAGGTLVVRAAKPAA